jgi:hypothetical protein
MAEKTRAELEKELEQVNGELGHIREREQILLRKFDSQRQKLDWAFAHPVRFMVGRIYHQTIKRDQKNVQN